MKFFIHINYHDEAIAADALRKAVDMKWGPVDEGLALLRKSDVETQRTLTMLYMLGDPNAIGYCGNRWRVARQVTHLC